jgi:hypothetical protein
LSNEKGDVVRDKKNATRLFHNSDLIPASEEDVSDLTIKTAMEKMNKIKDDVVGVVRDVEEEVIDDTVFGAPKAIEPAAPVIGRYNLKRSRKQNVTLIDQGN